MKNKPILIIGLIIVIIAITLVRRSEAPVVPVEPELQALYSTTTGERIAQIPSSDSGTPVPRERVITSAKEVKRTMSFACNDHKVIEGIYYEGGKNPRYEFTVTDYGTSTKDVQNEVRKFILTEVPSSVGIQFVNKDRSVILAANDDRGTLEEYGKPIVNNCLFQTTAIIQ